MQRIDGRKKRKKTLESYPSADWRDTEGILKIIDDQLQELGGELEVVDNVDDQYRIKVIKQK